MAEFPFPDLADAATRPFWEAAARGELALLRCDGCSAFVWYPRERCTACGGDVLTWTPVSGRGTLFSYAVVHQALAKGYASAVPYATGLVAIEEDPSVRVATLLVDCDPASLRLDQPVHVVFRPLPWEGEEVPAPLFTTS